MTINISVPTIEHDLKPKISVIGVGGAGGNAVNNMIRSNLEGVEFVVTNTDSQALGLSLADRKLQLGTNVTQGLGAGSRPDVGRAAAEEAIEEIMSEISQSNMVFITAGMGGGTGSGAAPVIAQAAREAGVLTIGVVTKPFHFEGQHRMRIADQGIEELTQFVDTLIIIPNQNLFRIANEKTTFAEAFTMADDVLHSGVRGVTDLMIMPGLINLDFADIRSVMSEMGKAMMGTGEAEGERRALDAAEAAIANPLLDDISMKGAKGVLINITGGGDMTLFEVDEAANRIRAEVDSDAYIIFGSTFDENLDGKMRISVVATGMDANVQVQPSPVTLDVIAPMRRTEEKTETEAKEEVAAAVVALTPEMALGAEQPEETVETEVEIEAEEQVDEEAAATGTLDHFAPADTTHAPPPPATPAANAENAFIPAAPLERTAEPAPKKAEPFAGAAMANGTKTDPEPAEVKSVKSRGISLFEKVTGTGRAAKAKAEAPAEVIPAPVPEAKPEVGGLDPADRIPESQSGDDLLDIPAFLRRQAN